MCGIICFLVSECTIDERNKVISNIKNRGPDSFDALTLSLILTYDIHLAASVLHTQGELLAKQPLILKNGDVLLWNGDIFGGLVRTEVTNCNLSDSLVLANQLEKSGGNVLKVMPTIEGPYSFIYLNVAQKRLWFGRDPLGRHSLLWKFSDDEIILSSVGHKSIAGLKEVPAMGLFYFDFENHNKEIHLFRWYHWKDDIPADELPFSISISDVRIDSFKNFQNSFDDPTIDELIFKNSVSSFGSDLLSSLLCDAEVEKIVNELLLLLVDACRKRILYKRNFCKYCPDMMTCSPAHAKLGVLFSGGLDSTVLACIADKFVPQTEAIDLLNVAFERNNCFEVPDRKTAKMSLTELQTICPNRTWNLIEINITLQELYEIRKNHISHLIYPLNTILDESLGCALWFACRGKGCVKNIPYTSSAKILLLGSGADEQFGGYVRHKNLLRRKGWSELQEQLLRETLLISRRNLGRDDRIASDSGRQARFPFLDESVVDFVAGLPSWKKCDPISFPAGIGDKLILRLVAMKLGLVQCATFPKRAFQFGCRIAKSKEKGDGFSDRL